MTFKDWVIARNLGKDSPRGDFAEDVRSDPDAPEEDGKGAWLEHLRRHNACPESVDVFMKLFTEYTVWRKKNRCF